MRREDSPPRSLGGRTSQQPELQVMIAPSAESPNNFFSILLQMPICFCHTAFNQTNLLFFIYCITNGIWLNRKKGQHIRWPFVVVHKSWFSFS
jgi:hypothetical protein